MKQKSVTTQVALSLLGAIVGAGIFGLPAVFSSAGILGGTILFVIILAVVLIVNQLYIDVIYGVKGKHRLPGYTGSVLGHKAYWIALISMLCRTAGTMLAYLILGGTFLHMLASGLGFNYPMWSWALIFWAICSLVVFYGVSVVCEIEDELTWVLIGFMLFTVIILFPFIKWDLTSTVNFSGFVGTFGIIFFAVTGMTILPDLKDIAKRNEREFRMGTAIAVLGAGILSWLFGIIIAVVYPGVYSVESIQKAFPPIFWWLIPAIGLLAVSTSYLTFTQALKNILVIDIKMKRIPAWIITVVIPVILFVVVSRNFLSTIGFVGGVLSTLNGVMICFAAYKILNQPQKTKNWIDSLLRRKPKIGDKYFWIWRYMPIPIAVALLFVMIEHILSMF